MIRAALFPHAAPPLAGMLPSAGGSLIPIAVAPPDPLATPTAKPRRLHLLGRRGACHSETHA